MDLGGIPPTTDQFFLNFMQFFGKIYYLGTTSRVDLCPLLGEILDPLLFCVENKYTK